MNLSLHKPLGEIKAIVVIPCFNEEQNLFDTCASLGFGIGNHLTPESVFLILINNNSTDSTAEIAEKIKLNSAGDTVILVSEKEQGFVPARHRGNQVANELAESYNWNINEVLILQADADTIYSPNYIREMRSKAKTAGENVFIEARSEFPHSFKLQYKSYIDLCDGIDGKFMKLFSSKFNDDIIVDDKVIGYRLADYFNWGGHIREYNKSGEEIYAETTRLYIRAKAKGAGRVLVDEACAFHSVRKILRNPALHLATAGFPREASWNRQWEVRHPDNIDLSILPSHINNPTVKEAIKIREKHLVALFCVLPIHVKHVTREKPENEVASFIDLIIPLLPERTLNDLSSHPSIFLIDVLNLIKKQGDVLVVEAYKFCFNS